MSDIEEQLLGSDEEETEVEDRKPKSSGRGLRAELEAQLAARKAAEAQAKEWETKYQEAQERIAITGLRDSGLTEKQAVAFRKTYGDVTEDNLREFRAEVLGQTVETEVVEEKPEAPLRPTPSSGSTPAESRVYTVEEFEKLYREDPVAAEKAYKAGRLKKEEPGWRMQTRFYGRDS